MKSRASAFTYLRTVMKNKKLLKPITRTAISCNEFLYQEPKCSVGIRRGPKKK